MPVLSADCNRGQYSEAISVTGRLMASKTVRVLRDIGWSGVVVMQSLLADEQLTGETRLCVLINGTVRQLENSQWPTERLIQLTMWAVQFHYA